MLNKYRLFQRANGVFYWQTMYPAKQGSLRTKIAGAAEKLLHARNEAHRLPTLISPWRARIFPHTTRR